jgi:hypothetical protein
MGKSADMLVLGICSRIMGIHDRHLQITDFSDRVGSTEIHDSGVLRLS